MTLTVIASIEAKPDCEAGVEMALRAMLTPTRAEPGCGQYVLHQELETPSRFVMLERWRDAQALDAHLASAHMTQLRRALDGLALSVTVTRLRLIA
jgi:quinol monooxygenase YgiN